MVGSSTLLYFLEGKVLKEESTMGESGVGSESTSNVSERFSGGKGEGQTRNIHVTNKRNEGSKDIGQNMHAIRLQRWQIHSSTCGNPGVSIRDEGCFFSRKMRRVPAAKPCCKAST